MDKQRWKQIQSIFHHLADKSPSHRRDYLDMVCEDGAELRGEVEALLESHDQLEQGDRDLASPVLQAAHELQRPHTVADYRILGELGRGGMGVVYLAEQPRYSRVALRLLPRFIVAAEEAQRRFTLEAEVLANLDHPALCHLIIESFSTREYAAIAMEFIDGTCLDERLEQGPLPFVQAVRIVIDLSDVLVLAHARGLTHRDIKPSNVLLDRQGQTKLIDFGIAKFADTKLTATGQVLGMPSYMSPEQWQGRGVDYRTDLWSLGVLLFELLSGSKPFTAGDRFAVANEVLTMEVLPLPPTSRDGHDLVPVQTVVDQLLMKNPDQRLRSCEALGEQLRALIPT